MMRTILKILVIVILVFTNSYAQLPHTFRQIARNTHYGTPRGLTVDSKGKVFLANGAANLMVFNYDGSSFINTAHIDNSDWREEANSVFVGADGTIFLITSSGLWAYTYNGSSYTNTAFLNIRGTVNNIVADPDGNIFLANLDNGLRAYAYDGDSFTQTAHINDGGVAEELCLGPDGTLFLANEEDGLRAYEFNGTSFTNTAHINDGVNTIPHHQDVFVDSGGAVFMANGDDGLRVYRYDGSSFTNLAHAPLDSGYAISVALDPDGMVYLACTDRVPAYSFNDTSLISTAFYHFNTDFVYDDMEITVSQDGTVFLADAHLGLIALKHENDSLIKTAHHAMGYAKDVTVNSDGTVFLANFGMWEMWGYVIATYGMQVYRFDGSSFNYVTHVNDNYFSASVTLDSNGTVFLANTGTTGRGAINYDDDGLRVYNYANGSLINKAHIDDEGLAEDVAVSPNGTIFLANKMDGLRAYIYNGTSLQNKAHINDGWNETVAVYSDSIVFVGGCIFDGWDYKLWAYKYDGIAFTNITTINLNTIAMEIFVDSDGTVFLANGFDGLRVYSFDGKSFTGIAHLIEDDVSISSVTIGPDGTIFLASGNDGLRAYSFNGNTFTNVAHINEGGWANGVKVGADGTVYLANGHEGLIAYEYSGFTTSLSNKKTQSISSFNLAQNYPNPFNPSTTIEFTLPNSEFVELKVFNILGKEVATIVSNKLSQGNHTYTFDGTNLASGIYYYQLVAGDFREVKKMILLR
jgi:sugar lactone lactonase YvrE